MKFEDKAKSELHGEVSIAYVLDSILLIDRKVPPVCHCATFKKCHVQLQNHIQINNSNSSNGWNQTL